MYADVSTAQGRGAVTVQAGARTLLIDGAWHASRDGRTSAVVSPGDGATLARVAQAGAEDLRDAVGAARRAFDHGPWPRMSGKERAQILYDAADLIEEDAAELARRQSLEMGKPLRFGLAEDVPFAAMALRYFAALVSQERGAGQPGAASATRYTLREPLGVVAALTSFHHPLAMTAAIAAPALASGNTLVHKPSGTAPLSALRFAEHCVAAGLPPGVLNVLTSSGPELGPRLAAHDGVDKFAFAGSLRGGRHVGAACAPALVAADLDLGRRNAHIVFADACLEYAARRAAAAVLPGSGEFRAAGARILVQRPVYHAFRDLLADHVRAFGPADPLLRTTRLGPVARADHLELLTDYLGWSRSHGGRVLAGGVSDGLYHQATLLAPADLDAAARMPEMFTPLALVLPFEDSAEAVAAANEGRGTHDCTVYTADLKRAHGVARAVRAATCRISSCDVTEAEPDEGDDNGQVREIGVDCLDSFTRPKTMWIDVAL